MRLYISRVFRCFDLDVRIGGVRDGWQRRFTRSLTERTVDGECDNRKVDTRCDNRKVDTRRGDSRYKIIWSSSSCGSTQAVMTWTHSPHGSSTHTTQLHKSIRAEPRTTTDKKVICWRMADAPSTKTWKDPTQWVTDRKKWRRRVYSVWMTANSLQDLFVPEQIFTFTVYRVITWLLGRKTGDTQLSWTEKQRQLYIVNKSTHRLLCSP